MTYQTYKSAFKGDIEDNVSLTSDEIIISDEKYIDVGLLDQYGNAIFRVKQPVGFYIKGEL